MKRSRFACLLLTAVCAVSLLCPAAWAAEVKALSATVERTGGNVSLHYSMVEQGVEDSSRLSAEVRQQVKTTARRTSDSSVSISTADRAEAESLLGIRLASSTAFDALQKGSENSENIVVAFRPSQKVDQTSYYQYRVDGESRIELLADTRWDESFQRAETVWIAPGGASVSKATYTAQTGETYQISSVKNAAGATVQQYVLFQNGGTVYTLIASGASLPQNYLYSILDTMTFPA